MLFVGDDWAEDHHDVYLINDTGDRLAARRLPEGLAGSHVARADRRTCRRPRPGCGRHRNRPGPVGRCFDRRRYQVFAVNPLAAARYRDRHHVSGAKSDASDAKFTADLVRTDRHNTADRRRYFGSRGGQGAAQGPPSLIWARTRHTHALRSALREYYPAALEAFDDLADRDALAILGAPDSRRRWAPEPGKIRSALKAAGRQRNLDTRALQIQGMLRTEQLAAPAAISAAFGATTRATVGIIAELNHQHQRARSRTRDTFETHPDADIYLSLPGLGVILAPGCS